MHNKLCHFPFNFADAFEMNLFTIANKIYKFQLICIRQKLKSDFIFILKKNYICWEFELVNAWTNFKFAKGIMKNNQIKKSLIGIIAEWKSKTFYKSIWH